MTARRLSRKRRESARPLRRAEKVSHGALFNRRNTALVAGVIWCGPADARGGTIGVAGGSILLGGRPGQITDPYWTSGQYKYDPNGYMERNR